MISWVLEILKTFYSWASAQPLFIQIPIGIALFLGGLYVLAWIMEILFLATLRRIDKRKEQEAKHGK